MTLRPGFAMWRAPLAALAAAVLAMAADRAGADAAAIAEITTPAGFTVWMVREPAIPIVAMEAAFRGGAALDPAGREGLARMVAATLDEGAGELDSLAFQTRLEELAIGLRFGARKDTFRASLKTLSRHREAAFDLIGSALTAPRFDAEPVERIRRQLLADVERRSEDPGDIAARAWFAKAFPGHPYGRPGRGRPESIAAIGRDDLRGFVRRRLARDNLVIGVVGDVDGPEIARLVDRAFAGLPAAAGAWTLPEASPPTPGSLTVIRREIPQSVVMLGSRGPKRGSRDWYAAYVMNSVLGGAGFTSRLYREVREKRGLAYSVYSHLHPYRHAGLVLGGLGTGNARVAEAIGLVRAEFARMAEEGIGAQELADAKTFLNGSFPLRLDSNGKIAATLVAMQLEALGPDYIERRRELIDAVTVEQVREAARRYLRVDDLIVVVVGEPEGLTEDGS